MVWNLVCWININVLTDKVLAGITHYIVESLYLPTYGFPLYTTVTLTITINAKIEQLQVVEIVSFRTIGQFGNKISLLYL